MLTTPVEFHECFEYSQVEFFDGDVHMLGEVRAKRLESFVNNSATPPMDNFETTSKIVADAKSQSESIALKQSSNASSLTQERPLRPNPRARLLAHSWSYSFRASRDLNPWFKGTDCGQQVALALPSTPCWLLLSLA